MLQTTSGFIDCVATNGTTILPLTIGIAGNTLTLNGTSGYLYGSTQFSYDVWHSSAEAKIIIFCK